MTSPSLVQSIITVVIMTTACRTVYSQILCTSTFDLTFLVDNSGSIRDNNPSDGSFDNWALMLQFMADFVTKFSIGVADLGVVRVSAVDFGNDGKVQFNYLTNLSAVNSSILGLQYRSPGEKTNTSDGIYKMLTKLTGNITAGNRPNASDVAILITDGKSTDFTSTLRFANEAKSQKKVTIYVIGVTSSANETELRLMSSSPQTINQSYWLIPDFQALSPTVESITAKICELRADPSTTTTTTTTTTTSTTTTTPQPQTVTTTVAIIPGVAASTTNNNTILIVVIVFCVILLLALLALLLVCCCYGPLAAWCASCCACCGTPAVVDRRKAVIVPFSTAVVKPEPIVDETPEYGERSTQCDLREPVPLPKPAAPPEVRTEVILQPVCSVCQEDIDRCQCNNWPCQLCESSYLAHSYGNPHVPCRLCSPHDYTGNFLDCNPLHGNNCIHPHSIVPRHHHLSDANNGRRYSQSTIRSGRSSRHSAAPSDVESCSSKIFLIPQTDMSSRSMESLASRGSRKPKRRKHNDRSASQGNASDTDRQSATAKSYIYVPLDCPDKMKDETQSYLNNLYNTSRSTDA